jgi:hypothetical protein
MAIVFTNKGKDITTNLVSGLGGTVPKFIGMGTDATTAVATDTALGVEVETRATGTPTRQTTTVANDTFQSIGTQTATASRVVVESGLFDASTVGNMFTSADFAAINLAIGDSIQFTWQLKYS